MKSLVWLGLLLAGSSLMRVEARAQVLSSQRSPITQAQTEVQTAQAHITLALVYNASFSPDGQRIVIASDDPTVRVWDAASGQPLAELKGHSAAVRNASFSPDGQRIVTASADHTARVWDALSF